MKDQVKRNKSKKEIFGEILIAISLISTLFIFYPFLVEEINYRLGKEIDVPVSRQFSLNIPVIRLSAPVIENVDPFNSKEYIPVLLKGVGHAKDSALPDQKGTVFLFAHSSDVPWRITRYNTAFYRINKLNIDDEIIINYKNQVYQYKVTQKKTVWPSEISYLTDKNQQQSQLILQTCTPIGTSLKRLLVLAKLEKTN